MLRRRYLHLLEDLPYNTNKLMVVHRQSRYQGVLQLRRPPTNRPEQRVKEIMNGEFSAIAVDTAIGALNGLIWALVVAVLVIVWFGNWEIGGIIAAAILLNLLRAALAGVAIPLVMRGVGVDPALAGSVVLTTVTDVVGFFAFLGLATLLLI